MGRARLSFGNRLQTSLVTDDEMNHAGRIGNKEAIEIFAQFSTSSRRATP